MAERAGDDRPLTNRDYRALARFRHALRTFLAFSEQAARDAGITPSQHQLLLAVRGWPDEESPTVGDLAEFLHTKPHSALELVRRAEQAGLVVLKQDEHDRRRQLVFLSLEGEHVLESLSRRHREELRRLKGDVDGLLGDLG
jgi:DNA-binding MarR family transcriptional regulator